MTSHHWIPRETNSHQDHVVAHILGTSLRGYLIIDEALHLLLDIGFVWTVLLDGEMGLLPHPVAVSELEVNDESREEIKADIDLLLRDNSVDEPARMKRVAEVGEINEASFFDSGERRRWLLGCENGNLSIETSLTTSEFLIYEC